MGNEPKRKSFLLHWVLPAIVLAILIGYAYSRYADEVERRETQRMLKR